MFTLVSRPGRAAFLMRRGSPPGKPGNRSLPCFDFIQLRLDKTSAVDFVIAVCDVVSCWLLGEPLLWVISQRGIWTLRWADHQAARGVFEVCVDVNGFWQSLTCKWSHCGVFLTFNRPGKCVTACEYVTSFFNHDIILPAHIWELILVILISCTRGTWRDTVTCLGAHCWLLLRKRSVLFLLSISTEEWTYWTPSYL